MSASFSAFEGFRAQGLELRGLEYSGLRSCDCETTEPFAASREK